MDSIIKKSKNKIRLTDDSFVRYIMPDIDWSNRMIAVKGARGVGKTTLLLQQMKNTYGTSDDAMYVSLDDIWFADNRLVQLADTFVNYGGKCLFLDEVHKYPDWSRELKNIYDDHRDLKVVFTSSSALEILKGKADLSRRVLVHDMYGLSFREYLKLAHNLDFKVYSLDDILTSHIDIAADIATHIKPLKYFKEYMKIGYYPYFTENKGAYLRKLTATIGLVLETDLPAIQNIDYYSVVKLKKLLYAIATSAPFKPNIVELSDRIGVTRDTLMRYLHYLDSAQLIALLTSDKKGDSVMVKPEKIFLDNTNIYPAIAEAYENVGTMRETFLFNQLKVKNQVNWSPVADFLVNGRFTIEVGGKNKKTVQIAGVPDSFVAADETEVGFRNTIPLWLFGMTY